MQESFQDDEENTAKDRIEHQDKASIEQVKNILIKKA